MEWKNYWSTHKNGCGAWPRSSMRSRYVHALTTRINMENLLHAFEFKELKSEKKKPRIIPGPISQLH